LVEFSDGTTQSLPLTWTDLAVPDPHRTAAAPGARLSGLALLELVRILESWKDER
jgi:hypothetical protein